MYCIFGAFRTVFSVFSLVYFIMEPVQKASKKPSGKGKKRSGDDEEDNSKKQRIDGEDPGILNNVAKYSKRLLLSDVVKELESLPDNEVPVRFFDESFVWAVVAFVGQAKQKHYESLDLDDAASLGWVLFKDCYKKRLYDAVKNNYPEVNNTRDEKPLDLMELK